MLSPSASARRASVPDLHLLQLTGSPRRFKIQLNSHQTELIWSEIGFSIGLKEKEAALQRLYGNLTITARSPSRGSGMYEHHRSSPVRLIWPQHKMSRAWHAGGQL